MPRRLLDVRVISVLLGLFALAAGPLLPADRAGNEPRRPGGDTFDRIDRYVRAEMTGSRIPGAAVAVVEGDRIVYARGFGDDGRGTAITPQTPFWIGSNTKSFTALATMQLVEAGRVDLDAPVRRYLPDFRTADADASARITVRHLLNQTSGFSRADGIAPVLEERRQSLEAAVADLRPVRLNRPVGDSFEYSNVNFVVLGLLVQSVSGQPWAASIREHVFAPLGMSHSFTTPDEARAHGLTVVHRYWFGLPVETEVAYLPGVAPTGWLYSSAEDMARYLSVYLRGGTLGGARVLSADGIRQMLAPATAPATRPLMGHAFTFRYGAGWFVGPFGVAADARWHLGNLPPFTAWMVLLPETDQAVVVLINAGSQLEVAGANAVLSRIPIGVVDLLRDVPPPTGPGLTRIYVVFDATVLLVVAEQGWSLARVRRRPPTRPRGVRSVIAATPLLWELGGGLALLLGVPATTGATWPQHLRATPDLALVLLVVAGLWLATGVARSLRLLRAAPLGRPGDQGAAAAPTARTQTAG
jgi:CubicO group peptidase (beta-lactamase class C family)